MAFTKVSWSMIDTASYTATQISDKTSTANTVNKYDGLFVWDITNNRLMRSSGSTNISSWWVVDGSVSVTPA
jgi:hypothetical protein